MDDNTPKFRPELFDYFGGHFDSDVIDLDDMDDVMYRAEALALTLRSIGLTPDEVSGPLRQALDDMRPEVIQQFSTASNGCWDFDERTEAVFRDILERIILTANGDGTLARTVSMEEYSRLTDESELEQQTPPKT